MKKKIIFVIIGILLTLIQTSVLAALPEGWGVGGGEDCKYVVSHEKKIAYEGRASLHIKFDQDYMDNHFIQIACRQFDLKTETKYRLGFYVKVAEGERAYWKWTWDWVPIQSPTTATNNEWEYHKVEFTVSKAGNYMDMIVDDRCDYYLDNVTVYELDNDGNTVGENLMVYGDFETGDFTPTSPVTEISTTPYDSAVKLSWTNPEDKDFSRVDIYMVDTETNEEFFLTSVLPKMDETSKIETKSSVLIDELVNDKLYNFKLYSIDSGDNISMGAMTFGLPKIDEYYVKTITAELIDEENNIITPNLSSIVSGKIRSVSNVKNNTNIDGITAVIITALYKNDTLVGVDFSEKQIAYGENVNLSAMVTVPNECEGYELYSYIWDGNGKIMTKSFLLN